jgi:hypothetical protein
MSGAVNFVTECRRCEIKCSGDRQKTRLWLKLHFKKVHAGEKLTVSKGSQSIETKTKRGNPRPQAYTENQMSFTERIKEGLELQGV